jgi:hypothetical protein
MCAVSCAIVWGLGWLCCRLLLCVCVKCGRVCTGNACAAGVHSFPPYIIIALSIDAPQF